MKYFSLISFVISLSACLFVLLRCEPMTADWLGILVGILAVLTTILIGWNIFYALNMKREILAEIDKVRAEFNNGLKHHSELNNKEFNNVLEAMKRSERFCNKLDESLLELLKGTVKRG